MLLLLTTSKHQPAHFSLILSSVSFCMRDHGTSHITMQFYFSLCKDVLSTEAFVMKNVTVDGKYHFKIFVDCFNNLSGGIRSSAVIMLKRKINSISKQLIKSSNSLRKKAGWSKSLHDAWFSSKERGSIFPVKTRFLFHQQNSYHLTVSIQKLIQFIQPYYH